MEDSELEGVIQKAWQQEMRDLDEEYDRMDADTKAERDEEDEVIFQRREEKDERRRKEKEAQKKSLLQKYNRVSDTLSGLRPFQGSGSESASRTRSTTIPRSTELFQPIENRSPDHRNGLTTRNLLSKTDRRPMKEVNALYSDQPAISLPGSRSPVHTLEARFGHGYGSLTTPRECVRDQVQENDVVVCFRKNYYVLNECRLCEESQFSHRGDILRRYHTHFQKAHPEMTAQLPPGYLAMLQVCGIRVKDGDEAWYHMLETNLTDRGMPSPGPRPLTTIAPIDRPHRQTFIKESSIIDVISSDIEKYEIDEESGTYLFPEYLRGVPVEKMGSDFINTSNTWITIDKLVTDSSNNVKKAIKSDNWKEISLAKRRDRDIIRDVEYFMDPDCPIHPNQFLAETYLPEKGFCSVPKAMSPLRVTLTKLIAARQQGILVDGATIEPLAWLRKKVVAVQKDGNRAITLVLKEMYGDAQLLDIVERTRVASELADAKAALAEIGPGEDERSLVSAMSAPGYDHFTLAEGEERPDRELTRRKRKRAQSHQGATPELEESATWKPIDLLTDQHDPARNIDTATGKTNQASSTDSHRALKVSRGDTNSELSDVKAEASSQEVLFRPSSSLEGLSSKASQGLTNSLPSTAGKSWPKLRSFTFDGKTGLQSFLQTASRRRSLLTEPPRSSGPKPGVRELRQVDSFGMYEDLNTGRLRRASPEDE